MPGFSGAAAIDGQGRLLGMATLKTSLIAGPAIAQGQLVSVETIKTFLARHNVSLSHSKVSSVEAAKAAVVRVICARK
jgi:hypothetical protein